jgi:hypothetical protein
VAFHKRVRNDEHCPTCRMYYLSFHDTVKSAVSDLCGKMDDIVEAENNVEERLLKGSSVWIDEWVRRRNGDWYQVATITSNVNYEVAYGFLSGLTQDNKINTNIRYMRLQTKINKKEWCPDNIQFFVEFFASKDECEKALKQKSDYFMEGDENEEEKDENVTSHYAIIPIQCKDTIHLNSYCPDIQPDKWND